MKFLSKKIEETLALGQKIGIAMKKEMKNNPRDCSFVIALEGDLGGGKTTFTKGIAKGLGIKEDITSPSFTLMKVYNLTSDYILKTSEKDREKPKSKLYHFNFYRIDNPKDMVGYELDEALKDPNGIVVVEWAEKIEANLPKERLVVRFRYVDENSREINLKATEGRYKKLLENVVK